MTVTQGFENISSSVITWSDVQSYIITGELYKLRRSNEETSKYRKHKQNLQDKHILINDYILGKLEWDESEITELNDVSYPTDNDKIRASLSDRYLFKPLINDFSYMFEHNVAHLLIWSKIRLPIYVDDTTDIKMDKSNDAFPTMNKAMKEKIQIFLQTTLTKKFNLTEHNDYIWFVNYSNLQSIKAISHIHLLIKFTDIPNEDSQDTKDKIAQKIENIVNGDVFEPVQ